MLGERREDLNLVLARRGVNRIEGDCMCVLGEGRTWGAKGLAAPQHCFCSEEAAPRSPVGVWLSRLALWGSALFQC